MFSTIAGALIWLGLASFFCYSDVCRALTCTRYLNRLHMRRGGHVLLFTSLHNALPRGQLARLRYVRSNDAGHTQCLRVCGFRIDWPSFWSVYLMAMRLEPYTYIPLQTVTTFCLRSLVKFNQSYRRFLTVGPQRGWGTIKQSILGSFTSQDFDNCLCSFCADSWSPQISAIRTCWPF